MAERIWGRVENGAVVEWVRGRLPEPIIPASTEDNPNPAPIYQDFRELFAEMPTYSQVTHQLADPVDTLEANRIVRTWPVVPRIMSMPDLIEMAAAVRWSMMERGCDFNGLRIPATDQAILRLKTVRDFLADGTIAEPIDVVVGTTTFQATHQSIGPIVQTLAQRMQQLFSLHAQVVTGAQASPPTVTTAQDVLDIFGA